jgi:hypothetical protein
LIEKTKEVKSEEDSSESEGNSLNNSALMRAKTEIKPEMVKNSS